MKLCRSTRTIIQFCRGPFSSAGYPTFTMQDLRTFLALLTISFLVAFKRSVSHEEKLRVVPGKDPIRFFPQGSPVHDYFRGHTSGLSFTVKTNDVTLMLLYAPWCLASQAARTEFDVVARAYKNQVAFVAINCAWHAGECAMKRHPEHFPLIGGYVSGKHRVFVNYRGVPTAQHLEIFLNLLLRPYVLLTTQAEVEEFVYTRNIAVLGILGPFSLNSQGLSAVWNTSLLVARHDPRGEVGFGVITAVDLAKAGALYSDSMYIFRKGKQVQIISELSAQADTFLDESVRSHMKSMPVRWIFPAVHKSFALSEILNNATVVVFTPYKQNVHCSSVLGWIHKIAAIYEDCDKLIDFSRMIAALDQHRIYSEAKCNAEREKYRLLRLQFSLFTTLMNRFTQSNDQECVCFADPPAQAIQDICWTTKPFGLSHQATVNIPVRAQKECAGMDACSNGLFRNQVYSTCCYQAESYSVRSAHRILLEMESCRHPVSCCNLSGLSQNKNPVDLDSYTVKRLDAIHGLKCTTNRSLEFIAIDSKMYPAFLGNLGITLPKSSSKVLISDRNASEKYVLGGEMNLAAIADFIFNYTRGDVRGYRRSSSTSSMDRGTEIRRITGTPRQVQLGEVTALTFLEMLDSSEDVVILYYTPWCTFCKAVTSIFYNLAAKFLDIPGIVFRRIDVGKNDLPWENKMHYVPAIQIFPTNRKLDNVATFPSDVPVTLINLLKFTLLHVSTSVWREFISARCDEKCWSMNQNRTNRIRRVLSKELKVLRGRIKTCGIDPICNLEGLKWNVRNMKKKFRALNVLIASGSAQSFTEKAHGSMESNNFLSVNLLRDQLIYTRST